MKSFECHICRSESSHEETVSEVFVIDARRVLVEGIPALVCDRCGEPAFSAGVAEHVRSAVHGASNPVTTIPLEVFVY